MNKKLFLFAPLLALAFIPKLVNTVNAATPTTETASYQDMVVRTAMNQGGAYSGTLVDYQIVHGNVANNNIQQFTTYVVGDSWTGSLGTEGDNAYCNHYKLFTQNKRVVLRVVDTRPSEPPTCVLIPQAPNKKT